MEWDERIYSHGGRKGGRGGMVQLLIQQARLGTTTTFRARGAVEVSLKGEGLSWQATRTIMAATGNRDTSTKNVCCVEYRNRSV